MEEQSSIKTKKQYLFFISQDYSFPVLRPLQKAIHQRGDTTAWFLYGNDVHSEYLHDDELLLNTIEEAIHYKPDAVFVPGNVVPSFIPGLKVQVFHGLPGNKSTKKGEIYHYIIRGMFDLYCTQGPSSTHRFKKLSEKHGFFHVAETGWSKLDPLFQDQTSLDTSTKSIFFASTFSPRYSKANILYPFIVSMIEKYDYHWYITLHPMMNQQTVNLYKSIPSDKVTFVSPVDIISYFKYTDIMLCDISSIVFEYMTQLKPVITFQSPQKSPSLMNVSSFSELENTLLQILNATPQEMYEQIKEEVSQYHPYHDGKSSERVLDCVEEMLSEKHKPKKKKPLNIIRNLKLRKVLNFWKF